MAAPRRAVVVIGIGVLTAAVLGAAAALFIRSGDDEPDLPDAVPATTEAPVAPGDPAPAAQAFLVNWAREDWTALNALSTDLSAGSNHADWWRSLAARNVELTLGDVELLSETRAFARFDIALDVSTAGRWSYSSQLTLIWDGASWLVDWFPDVLHPRLTGGDRLELVRTWSDRAPIRGIDGSILATTLPTVQAGVIPDRMSSREAVRAAFDEFTAATAEDVDAALDAPNVQPDWFLPIADIAREDYPVVRPALYPVPGIAFRIIEGRAPVEPGLALHVLGSTGEISAELLSELGEPYRVGDVVGRTPSSLERAYERTLAGTPTTEVVKVGAAGDSEVLHTFAGEAAHTLDTTLSLRVQRAAEAALEGVPTPAALVAIDVASGGIRAIVSRPLDGFNRAATGLYPPGSTFKLVVTLAALESGFTPDSSISCPGEVEVGGQTFGNAESLPRSMDLEQALVRSCNTAFIQLAGTLDPEAIDRAASQLGFNLDYTIGIGTPGGVYPSPAGVTEAAAAAIGQARVQATPVHMASVAAGIANGGWLPPTLIDRPALDAVDPIDPALAETMRELMVRVVADRAGTGRNARVEGREVGGKTGTAQLGSGEEDPLVTWFVGFSEDLAFAVMVEEGESGGRTAAPIAAAFLELLDQIPESGFVVECADATSGWPTFQGTAARTGCASGVEAPTDPAVRWAVDVGSQAWLNNPIVVGDLVVVGTAGSSRGRADSRDGIVAVRLGDGSTAWRVGSSTDVNGVAAAEGTVVATGDEGKVWALRAADGGPRWEFDAGTLVFTNPLIVDGRVIIGDAAGWLRALALADGTELWSQFLGAPIRGGAASDGTLIYAASEEGKVAAISLDGDLIWERDVQPSSSTAGQVRILATPTLVGESVVFSVVEEGTFGGPALVAFDRFVGTERWRAVDGIGAGWSNVYGSAAVADGALVFASSLSSGVQAVDAASGAAIWYGETRSLCDRQWGSPIMVGGTVVVARTDGSLYAFGPSGDQVWELELTTEEDDAVVAECTRGEVEVLTEQLQATPAVAPDGTILIGSLGGWLYAVAQSPG